MPKKPKPISNKFSKYWGSRALGYLKLAERGLLYIKDEVEIPLLYKKSNLKYGLEDGSLIIASIWNIKHGLELVLKSLNVHFNKQYWNNHDLSSLFKELEVNITDYSLRRDLVVLQDLAMKYHECRFSKKTQFSDFKNDYLRYPEVENGSLDYSFVHDLTKRDFEIFLDDIFNLRRAHGLLETEISYYKSMVEMSKRKVSKEEADKMILKVSTIKDPGYKKS